MKNQQMRERIATLEKALDSLIYWLHNFWSDVDNTPEITQADVCNKDYWIAKAKEEL